MQHPHMKRLAMLAGAALVLGGGAAMAQTAPNPDSDPGRDASQAQLQREHNRAVKAGDTANDPMNSASSDALNQQQLQGTPMPNSAAPDAGGPAAPPPTPDAATTPPPPDAAPPAPTTTDSDSSSSSSSSM